MAARSSPVRICVGCRERAAKSDLLRLVVMADDEATPPTVTALRRVVPDPTGRRPGRGAYVHPDLSCLDLATRRRAFPKAFRLAAAPDVSAVRAHLEPP